jgi:uncharacterized protein
MPDQTTISGQKDQQFKRNIAFKMRVGDILSGKVIIDGERLKCLEFPDKTVVRINLIANVIEKFIQDNEKKFGSLTLDDASGQIKLKVFGEDINKFENFSQGDTIMVIGVIRTWNNELYIIPEIIKKKEPQYLLVRKLELELDTPKSLSPDKAVELKDKLLSYIKIEDPNGGAETEKIILELKSSPEAINQEIKKLLEDGIIYEPRPGVVRYLG